MSETIEKLRQELQAARGMIAELQAKVENREATHRLATLELQENRSALLFMLEDLENARKKIEQSHKEWMDALDVVDDPIFMHDGEYRVLRCNKAYQQCAGIPFHDIIGRPYYEIFPKRDGPLACCRGAMGKEAAEEEEVKVGDATYRSRAFSINDEHGAYLYSVHVMDDVTESRRAEKLLHENEQNYRTLADASPALIWASGADHLCNYFNQPWLEFTGRTLEQELGNGWADGVHPDDLQRCLDVYLSAFDRHEPFSMEYRLRRHDGEFRWMRDDGCPRYDSDGNFIGYLGYLMDVTGRRQAEQELRLRAQFLDGANDSIFVSDFDGNFVYLNEVAWKSRGYTREELLGMNLHALDTPEYEKLLDNRFSELLEKGHCIFESAHHCKDGSAMPIEVSARLIESGGRKLILSAARDITERKQAEEILRVSESRFSTIFNQAPLGIALIDSLTGHIYEVNPRFAEIAGRTMEEMTSIDWISITHPDDVQEDLDNMALMNAGKIPGFNMDKRYMRPDGSFVWINMTIAPLRQEKNVSPRHLCMIDDITARKNTEEQLQRSEHSLKEAQRIAHLGSWDIDLKTNALIWSDEIYRIFEIDREKFAASYDAFLNAVHPDDREVVDRAFNESVKDKAPYGITHRLLMQDGRVKYVSEMGETYYGTDGKPKRSFGIVHDVTERKQAEIALNHANRALAALSAVNRDLVHANSEEELLQSICRSIVEQHGYRMAWVGYAQHDENKSVKIMASAGYDEGYLDNVNVSWAENERGMGPTGRAIRSGTTQLCQDFANDPRHLLWREAALKRGYAASIALPLADGEVFGALMVYADEVNAFSRAEVELLEEMAEDMAFGVHALHIRQERDLALEQNRRQLAQLQSNLEETVRAIATIVEMRDPYTAGHQARVADLAAAIARQMGLPDEQVHGIHLAGVLHDLWKIRIPAEILSKPGKISDIERNLIKTHPQAGYDILQGINFPWPIAKMALQHHERLDGSGYPQGLKGDAILFEARILGVADVVESMSSHRPYRPGWGVDAALDEITRQRGIHFDPRVVDACLQLFREDGYRLPD